MTALPTTWSFSRWQTWENCPLKYKLQFVDKLPVPQSPAMARGNDVHKALAAYLGGEGDLPPEVKDPFQKQLYAEMRAQPAKLVEQQWGFDRRWGQTQWFGKAVWLRSILDVAIFYEDDSAHVVDHKTGKVYGDNADQMELFGLTMFERFPLKTKNGVKTTLVYVDAGQEQSQDFLAADAAPLRIKWESRAERMLADRQFMARPNEKCRFCPFSRSAGGQCRFG